MRSKDRLIHELTETAQSMVQGSLSELTRQCGDPSCACARDPQRRHGPHLYLKFNDEGKTYSVYVPPAQGEALKTAHRAWLRFQELGAEVSASNRARFLRALQREKQMVKAKRAKPRGTAEVIEVCRRQINFAEGLIAEEVGELWEDWMRQVDEVLTDQALLCTRLRGVGAALAEQSDPRTQRHPRRRRAAACCC